MLDFATAQAFIMPFLAENERPAWWGMLPMLAIMGVLLLVMVVLPGKQQAKRRKVMLSGMSKNDRVLTRGGIIGVVVEIRDNDVILKVDETNNIRMHFAKQAIQHVFADKDDIDPAQAEAR